MICLDSLTRKLQAVLAGAVSANQPQAVVFFYDIPPSPKEDFSEYRGGTNVENLNNTTDVDICDAPDRDRYIRNVRNVSIYNRDTAAVTVIVKIDDGGTEHILIRVTLATLESLHYEDGEGWYTVAANGAVKLGAGVSGPASSTDNAVVRWDGSTATVVQNSAFVVDDSGHVTSFGGNITFPASQAASTNANTLDDYEEGTYTVTGTFGTPGDLSIAYSIQDGNYIKIGKKAFIDLHMVTSTFTHTTASGNFNIGTLPFATSASTNERLTGKVSWQGITKANYTEVALNAVASQTAMNMQASGSAQNISAVVAADMPTAGSVILRGSATYVAAA